MDDIDPAGYSTLAKRPAGRAYPTPQEWERQKGRMHDLYLVRDMTTNSVIRIMRDQHNFHASARMFKQRFTSWGWSKKSNRSVYLAMDAVARHRQSQGLNTVFELRKGLKRIQRTHEQVRKELLRRGKTDPMDLSTAHDLLQEQEVRVVTATSRRSANRPLMSNGVNISPSILSPAPRGSSESDQEESELDEYFSDCSYPSESHDVAIHTSSLMPVIPHQNLTTTYELSLPRMPQADIMSFTPSSTMPSQEVIQSEASVTLVDPLPFDFAEMFTKYSTDSLLFSATDQLPACFGDEGQLFVPSTSWEQKLAAGEWAAPFYLSSEGNHNPINFDLCKQKAMNIFKLMIQSNVENRFMFPCLSWMMTVLAYNNRHQHLTEFLVGSCKVIDESGLNIIFGTLFHYALAVATKDEAAIAHQGEQFAQSHPLIVRAFGEDSPNVLVSLYYLAWHLLHNEQFNAVIDLLRNCLSVSERVMGRCDLVSINCLVMLSRAYEGIGANDRALEALRDAVDRVGDPDKHLRAFKWLIVERLAKQLLAAEQYSEAEHRFRLVVEGRIELLGWFDGDTWGAIENLRGAIERQGHHDRAKHLATDMDRRYAKAWYQTNTS